MVIALLEVATIDKPHGLKGEVIVTLVTNRTERLDPGTHLHSDRGILVVERSAPHQRRWRVAFEGYSTREDAESLRGLSLRAEPIEDPDEWFVHELIGASVATVDGHEAGVCVAVMANPAYDLLELDSGALVPLPFVTEVDLSSEPPRITIDPPDGLLDLHEADS